MNQNNASDSTNSQNICKKQSILADLDACPLHRKSPFGITNVTQTQFSIARYYGGINFNGSMYIYCPDTDELIREDVMKWKAKQLKAKQLKTKNKKQSENSQQELI
jgi:hypothetical protein